MRLIDNHKVVVGDGGRPVAFVIENPLHHALHRGDLHAGFLVNGFFVQSLDAIYIVQRHQLFELDFLENVLRLLAEGVAVHEEQDAAETSRFEEAVNHAEDGARLARACRHSEQDVSLPSEDGVLRRLDGADLVLAEIQPVLVAQ